MQCVQCCLMAMFQLSQLHLQPVRPSWCSIWVPTAGWANASLASVSPASLTIAAAAWNSSRTIQLQPSENFTDGPYFVTLQFK